MNWHLAVYVVFGVVTGAFHASMGADFRQKGLRSDPNHEQVVSHDSEVVCYWGSWSNYRPSKGKFTPENIDPKLCTNIIYTFAGLDGTTWEIKSLDPWMDLADNYGLAGFEKTTALKYSHPKLKVTIAIGGWNQGSTVYSEMAKDPSKRSTFVKSAVDFLIKYNFDGLDLDWEYPAKRGGKPEDKQNFISLIKDLKAAFEPHNFLLTAAIGAPVDVIDLSYDVPNMYKYLDFVHVMCYDYHGKWDMKTGHNSPLYVDPKAIGKDTTLNIETTINHLMESGAIAEKTILGVPFYGRSFILANPHDHRMSSRATGKSFSGPYTKEDGFLGYNEICEELGNEDSPWTVEWNNYSMAPFAYNDLKWVGFDNEKSIRAKTLYSYSRGLGGVMIWTIDTDDFGGNCGNSKYPLLRTVNNALYMAQNGLVPGVFKGSGSKPGPEGVPNGKPSGSCEQKSASVSLVAALLLSFGILGGKFFPQ